MLSRVTCIDWPCGRICSTVQSILVEERGNQGHLVTVIRLGLGLLELFGYGC